MIEMLRIDDRLLHGQVVFMWCKQLDINGIIVANDEVVNDEFQTLTMKLAVPDNIRLLIRSVDDSIRILHDERIAKMKILVIVKDPIDALHILQNIDDHKQILQLNVGNSGRVEKESKTKLTKEIYVDDKDLKALSSLCEYDIPFHLQMVPTAKKISIQEILNETKKG